MLQKRHYKSENQYASAGLVHMPSTIMMMSNREYAVHDITTIIRIMIFLL